MHYWEIFKRLVSQIPGTVCLYHFLQRLRRPEKVVRVSLDRGSYPVVSFSNLKEKYLQSPLSNEPDIFVLYRIIGNDLAPRHRKGQSRENLRFRTKKKPLCACWNKRTGPISTSLFISSEIGQSLNCELMLDN